MNIILISCVGKKKPHKCKARELYNSIWFHYAWGYGNTLDGKIFILSAKYGLLDPETEVEPYEETLNTKSDREIRAWSDTVLESLRRKANTDRDSFVILAGERYRRHLVDHLPDHIIPMEGLTIGRQLKWLKDRSPR